jgi:hypothetical protein
VLFILLNLLENSYGKKYSNISGLCWYFIQKLCMMYCIFDEVLSTMNVSKLLSMLFVFQYGCFAIFLLLLLPKLINCSKVYK